MCIRLPSLILSTHAETLPHIMGEILIYQNYNLTFVVEIFFFIFFFNINNNYK